MLSSPVIALVKMVYLSHIHAGVSFRGGGLEPHPGAQGMEVKGLWGDPSIDIGGKSGWACKISVQGRQLKPVCCSCFSINK